ncbi:MAG: SulP family inorganic anion transporter [Bacteroidota bacterium]
MSFLPKDYLQELQFSEVLKFDLSHLKGDLIGGLTSAVVALPLALGFGILAYNGDPRGAVAGLYGAIFTGFFASLFGGTARQITGPTGLDHGIAIPHSRMGSAGSIIIVIARLAAPIEYEILDSKPVDLVFMIAASGKEPQETWPDRQLAGYSR